MIEFERAACEAAARAGEVLRRRFREQDLAVEAKGLHDYVTAVDREAEEAAVGWIRERFPDHVIMSEEGSPEVERAAYRWVIDPLDGTTNFIHGVTPFAVSVALEDAGGPLAAAILDPMHDETFRASRGNGAFCNDEPMHVSAAEAADGALLATGFPFRELSRLPQYLESFEAFARSTAGIRRAGSAAMDLARTAAGRYDGFWEIGLSRWDIAAGVLLVREAGGIVTDPLGAQTELDSGDILAAGPAIHAFMLDVTRRAFG
ncbi:MAG: inositol monophosphatase [Acidobacteria bacterium]|nr:inositol monophosphatase [Acidobacteriota bacterium]